MQIRKRSGKEWRVTALLVLLLSTNCAFCQDCQQNDVLSRIRGMVSSSSGNSIPQLITPSLSLPKSKEFYRKMLEDFCIANYNKRFQNRRYVYGSLRVDSFRSLSNNIVEVWGTHSYKVVFSHDNRDFKATIRMEGRDKYQVKFEKKSDIPLVSWESTDVPFTYTP